MKLLYSYSNNSGTLNLLRGVNGMYYLDINGKDTFMLPPAKADELRMALLVGYRPSDELKQIAVNIEPKHLDD